MAAYGILEAVKQDGAKPAWGWTHVVLGYWDGGRVGV